MRHHAEHPPATIQAAGHAPPDAPSDSPPDSPPISPFAPLRRAAFRSLWIAALASNIGTWMHDVGAGWAMTTLGASALMVAMVQAAATTPMFLLSLPAGAFADVVDRRRLMLTVQAAMLLIALLLAWSAWGGWLTAYGLLAATAGLGVGAALINPAWQTAMTDLVPANELPSASALNSVSLNLSRAVGPALGGLLVARFGPPAVFALNAVSFLGIIAALWAWKYQRPPQAAPAERFLGALEAGVRYVRHSPSMRSQLVRTASFTLFASAVWALLPLIARRHLEMGPAGYGLLLGSLGAGAVAGTFLLVRARTKMTPNAIVIAATSLSAAATATVGLVNAPWLACFAMAGAGVAWVSMVVCLNVAALAGTPGWVRARALACYFTVLYGAMAIGSAAWGSCADLVGIPSTLLIASAGLLAALVTIRRHPLRATTPEDFRASNHWEDPAVAREIRADDGPVVVTIEYFIDEPDVQDFIAAMGPVSQTRYRDGAFSWTLSRCTENPRRWLEVFMVESWAEHLRQHARTTFADKKIQVRAKRFHTGPDKPKVSHFVAVDVPRGQSVQQEP